MYTTYLYILVKNAKDVKSINYWNDVSIDLSLIYFIEKTDGIYINGTILFKYWYSCSADYQNYKLVCLYADKKPDVDDYVSYGVNFGESIICDGNDLYSQKIDSKYKYVGCAILQRNTNKYIASNAISISNNYKNILDISGLYAYKVLPNSILIGKVKYQYWDECEKDSINLSLVCIIKTNTISQNSFISTSSLTKYKVNCNGNVINAKYSGFYHSNIYYGCALLNKYDEVYDFKSKSSSYTKSSIDISSLKVVNQSEYKTVSGVVYYPKLLPCSTNLLKLVCIMTKDIPNDNDFLISNNKLFDVRCYGTNVNLRINNIVADILSCSVIDKTRSLVYIHETQNQRLNNVIDLDNIKREDNRNNTISHIKGTIHYKNWNDCSLAQSLGYSLRCYASYDGVKESDMLFGYSHYQRIKCEGNTFDDVINGKGKHVYFGCAIVNDEEIIVTSEIKKIKIRVYLLFLLKMFGYAVAVNVVAPIVLLCVFFCYSGKD